MAAPLPYVLTAVTVPSEGLKEAVRGKDEGREIILQLSGTSSPVQANR